MVQTNKQTNRQTDRRDRQTDMTKFKGHRVCPTQSVSKKEARRRKIVLDLTATPYTSLKGWQIRPDMVNMIYRDTQMAW